jgi:hypothetical protein
MKINNKPLNFKTMKKVILAIGMILPMMSLQAQIKVLDVKIENKETVSGIGYVSVSINEIDNSAEIAVTINVTVSETGVKVTGEKTNFVAYISGDNVIIESSETPNGKFQVATMNGVVVASGKLGASGKAEIENLSFDVMYVISIGNKISEKIVK